VPARAGLGHPHLSVLERENERKKVLQGESEKKRKRKRKRETEKEKEREQETEKEKEEEKKIEKEKEKRKLTHAHSHTQIHTHLGAEIVRAFAPCRIILEKTIAGPRPPTSFEQIRERLQHMREHLLSPWTVLSKTYVCELQCAAVCCSVLQCVAVCFSALQSACRVLAE